MRLPCTFWWSPGAGCRPRARGRAIRIHLHHERGPRGIIVGRSLRGDKSYCATRFHRPWRGLKILTQLFALLKGEGRVEMATQGSQVSRYPPPPNAGRTRICPSGYVGRAETTERGMMMRPNQNIHHLLASFGEASSNVATRPMVAAAPRRGRTWASIGSSSTS
jgi:hypothetical protein